MKKLRAEKGVRTTIAAAMKICPFCAGQVQDAAIKCRYCSSDLKPRTSPRTRIANRLRL